MSAELRFALLGPVRAWRGDAELGIGSPQQRAVLAMLLLAESRQVPLDALIDALWGNEPPRAAAGAVRTYVSRLRHSLGTGAAGGTPMVIESAGAGYLLPLAAAGLDLSLFLGLSAEAREARDAGDADLASALLCQALGLWQGPPLVGVPGEYAGSQRIRLAQLQLAAVEDRLALDIELGRQAAAAAELQVLIAAHPLRERLSELLMLALYRSGRQAEALAVFSSIRRLLRAELGIDPGPAVQELHQRILQSDDRLRQRARPRPPDSPAGSLTPLSDQFAAATAPAARRSPTTEPLAPARLRGPRPLPAGATSLLGRDAAIKEVAGPLEDGRSRLVTLTGPGGIGKTRLALAIGERLGDRFDGDIVFASLVAVTDARQALEAIGRAAGADLGQSASPVEALAEQFGDDRWLLILDNLEQVRRLGPELGTLLARCRGLAILATSRTALGLRAEHEYPVPPLSLPAAWAGVPTAELAACPAVELFADRARAVHPGFTLTGAGTEAVADICRRLECLPLAIELAAARTRLLDPGALLSRLAASLDALGTGPVDLPERQRTLRATVAWSVGLLDDAERSLLEIMAVFTGGWTVDAAAQVAGLDQDRTLQLLEALARHSLVVTDFASTSPRLRMLETIRVFIAERLADRADAAQVSSRHAAFYRDLVRQADRPLRGAGQNEWADRLEADAGNLAAAIRWHLAHDPSSLPSLFRILWPFLFLRDHQREASAWVGQLLAGPGPLDPQARAELAWAAAVTGTDTGDDGVALPARQHLGSLLDEMKDPLLHALSQLAMAWISPMAGGLDQAVREASASLSELRGQQEPFWTALAAATLGSMETAAGRCDDALPHLLEARDLARELDSAWLTAGALMQLGALDTLHGRLGQAEAVLGQAMDLSVAARSIRSVTSCLAVYARLATAQDDPGRAALLAGAAAGLSRRAGLQAWPTARRGEAELAAQVRRALGPDKFRQAFSTGATLSLREAAAAARNRSGPQPQDVISTPAASPPAARAAADQTLPADAPPGGAGP